MQQFQQAGLGAHFFQIFVELGPGIVGLVLLPGQEHFFFGAGGAVAQPLGIVAGAPQRGKSRFKMGVGNYNPGSVLRGNQHPNNCYNDKRCADMNEDTLSLCLVVPANDAIPQPSQRTLTHFKKHGIQNWYCADWRLRVAVSGFTFEIIYGAY